jgi:hypothetical protein
MLYNFFLVLMRLSLNKLMCHKPIFSTEKHISLLCCSTKDEKKVLPFFELKNYFQMLYKFFLVLMWLSRNKLMCY